MKHAMQMDDYDLPFVFNGSSNTQIFIMLKCLTSF